MIGTLKKRREKKKKRSSCIIVCMCRCALLSFVPLEFVLRFHQKVGATVADRLLGLISPPLSSMQVTFS